MTTRAHLIKEVTEQMRRIWGPEGLKGESDEYQWIQTSCGITEGDDVRWQIIVEHEEGNNLGDWDDDDRTFLIDDEAVVRFLEDLRQKYKSSTSAFRRQYPIGSLEHARSRLNEDCFKHSCALIAAFSLADEGPRVVLDFDAFCAQLRRNDRRQSTGLRVFSTSMISSNMSFRRWGGNRRMKMTKNASGLD